MADQPTPGNPTLSTTGNPNTGAAYSYVAPPLNGPQDENMNWTNFIFFLFMALVVSIFSICLFINVILVSLFLHSPEFGIEKVTGSNLSISSYSQISGDWEMDFIFRNPNRKVNLYYDDIEVVASFKTDSIARTIVPPFMQIYKNETTIRSTFTSLMMYVHDEDSIKGERSHGSSTFNLRMMVRVQARVWWAGTWALTVDCSKLKIAVSLGRNGGSGTLVGGSKKCTAFS